MVCSFETAIIFKSCVAFKRVERTCGNEGYRTTLSCRVFRDRSRTKTGDIKTKCWLVQWRLKAVYWQSWRASGGYGRGDPFATMCALPFVTVSEREPPATVTRNTLVVRLFQEVFQYCYPCMAASVLPLLLSLLCTRHVHRSGARQCAGHSFRRLSSRRLHQSLQRTPQTEHDVSAFFQNPLQDFNSSSPSSLWCMTDMEAHAHAHKVYTSTWLHA